MGDAELGEPIGDRIEHGPLAIPDRSSASLPVGAPITLEPKSIPARIARAGDPSASSLRRWIGPEPASRQGVDRGSNAPPLLATSSAGIDQPFQNRRQGMPTPRAAGYRRRSVE